VWLVVFFVAHYCSYLGVGVFTRWYIFWLHSSSVMVCARVNLDFVGMLVSRIGGGSGVSFRPFVVHPPSCGGGRFHTTECSFVKPGEIRLNTLSVQVVSPQVEQRTIWRKVSKIFNECRWRIISGIAGTLGLSYGGTCQRSRGRDYRTRRSPPNPCLHWLPTNKSSDVLLLEMARLLEGHNGTGNVGLLLRSKNQTAVPSM